MLFARGPILGLRLIILVVVSVILMISDYRHHLATQTLRKELSIVTTPVLYITHAPFALFDSIAKDLQSHQTLLQENTALRAQVLILQGELQKLQGLQAENQQLRALLQSSAASHHVKLLIAEIMAIQASPFRQEVMLNKGSHAGVFVGQAVLDAHGIMGQVIDVTPYTSRVLLLTDPRSGIPIQNDRNGLHGILIGQGNNGVLSWIDVPPTADVSVGDILVSSGLGGHYPVGYPVGIVSAVNRHTDDQFLQIQVAPSAQMNSNEQVLLVWPDKK